MTSDACREMRAALGAAALAGVDPVDDIALRAHLDGCPDCRAELRELILVARALPLADPEQVEQAVPQPSPGLAERVLDRVARQRARRRDRVRRRALLAAAAAAAVAAVIVASVLFLSGSDSGGTQVAFPRTAGVTAHATLRGHAAGTEVAFHVEGLHVGDYYWLWLTDEDDHRVAAGTFRGTSGPVDVTMTAAIRLRETRRIWVTEDAKADVVVLDTLVPGS
jgi:predicted anti-sigma-YlaC factor YlaD